MTLIELICVMAIITVVLTISAPALSGFFKGRFLEEESRRFLALTRQARSEAVSRSELMELWIAPESGEYGLKSLTAYYENRGKIEYRLEENLKFEVDPGKLDDQGKAVILFWPDGTIDRESLEELSIIQNDKGEIVIQKAESGAGFLIKGEDDDD